MGRCYRNNFLGVNDNSDVLGVSTCNSGNCNRSECMMDNLCNLIGCNCNFQFDTQNSRGLEDVNGILEEVGDNFITIRSTTNGRRTMCNTNNLQFVNIL